MSSKESTPFESAEEYYAEHRPDYADEIFDYLQRRFDLNESARVLDLGCGAGQLTIPLAARAGEVVGMDPNEEMLRQARERVSAADSASEDDIRWVAGSDVDLHDEMGPFRLTTMGRAFHWMDQESTLEQLRRITESGGGVALVTDSEWLTKGTEDWQSEVYDLVAEYLDDVPERTGPAEYDDPWDELLETFEFEDVEHRQFAFAREWTIDGVVGYVFSLSFCSPATFGDDVEAFEAALRSRLHELDALDAASFRQTGNVDVISGRA
ncbi:class I SAM-dependent methyltransferase [Halorussus halophilus]|uniref:class I SAM-dependent methyltransferase n=1 Tax=Halorussus halophilus TaxID=2650975 RepID=UPI0017880A65|nr:class I SAM-dependent methyltransferase [Halorussus halophilus]